MEDVRDGDGDDDDDDDDDGEDDDDENQHFSTCLCRSILEHCVSFVSQHHGVSKNNGIYHGFGTSEDCTDAVSQRFFLFMLGRCGVLSFPQRFLEAFA